MEKRRHKGIGGAVCSVSSAKVFTSFCLDYSLVLAIIGVFWSVKHSFLKMRGQLRRASLELWTLVRKQERKGLIEKNINLTQIYLCGGVPQAFLSAASSRTTFMLFKQKQAKGPHRMCCLTISFSSDFNRNLGYSPSPLMLSALIVSSLVFARRRKDILFLRIWWSGFFGGF